MYAGVQYCSPRSEWWMSSLSGVFSPVYGHFKRLYAALCPKVVCELKAHDSLRKRIRDQREVQEARSGPDVRDVADPDLLWPGNLQPLDRFGYFLNRWKLLVVRVKFFFFFTSIPASRRMVEEPVPAALDPMRRQFGRKQVVQLPAAQPAQNPALGGHQAEDGSRLGGHLALTAFCLVVPLPGYPE